MPQYLKVRISTKAPYDIPFAAAWVRSVAGPEDDKSRAQTRNNKTHVIFVYEYGTARKANRVYQTLKNRAAEDGLGARIQVLLESA